VTESDAHEDSTEPTTADHPRKRPLWREILILVVVALVLSVVIQNFVGRIFLIPSESMEPTLHGCTGCTGDKIFVDRISYRFGDPQPGDVVVFKGPESWNDEYQSIRSDNSVVRALQGLGSMVGLVPPDENDLVKRVVAVGGQTVQCLSEEEGLRVNDKPLTEPYIDNRISGNGIPCQGIYFGPVTVPDGNLWVMGDNRGDSKDSRFHLDDELSGTVPIDNVIGKVQLIVLPFSRLGTVSSFDPQ
jgi:signal peptidase I